MNTHPVADHHGTASRDRRNPDPQRLNALLIAARDAGDVEAARHYRDQLDSLARLAVAAIRAGRQVAT